MPLNGPWPIVAARLQAQAGRQRPACGRGGRHQQHAPQGPVAHAQPCPQSPRHPRQRAYPPAEARGASQNWTRPCWPWPACPGSTSGSPPKDGWKARPCPKVCSPRSSTPRSCCPAWARALSASKSGPRTSASPPSASGLNHFDTRQCVTAERAFLAAMGGGCQSPVAAYAEIVGSQVQMRALSFASGPMRRAQAKRPVKEAAELGQQLATELKG